MKIKIGWKEYGVIQQDSVTVDNQKCYGSIDYDSQVINLWNENSDGQYKATLIHELLHGLDEMYSIGLTEQKITKLGNALYTLFKDNKKLKEQIF